MAIKYINYADPPSKYVADINDNFKESGGSVETSIFPTSGSIPQRTVENGEFTGGRLKTTTPTDPEDCINKAYFDFLFDMIEARLIALEER